MARISFIMLYDDVGLGVRLLSAVLSERGHETFLISLRSQEDVLTPPLNPIIDPRFGTSIGVSEEELSLLIEILKRQKPDWVGISVVSNHTDLAEYVSRKIRESLSAPIVWGGIEATVNPERAIEHADVVCIGEAEDTVIELTEAFMGKTSLSNVAGIWYREGKKIRATAERPPVTDLDRFPRPDYRLSNYTLISQGAIFEGQYHPGSVLRVGGWPLLTSRGCPFQCSYCCNGIKRDGVPVSHKIRRHSPERVAQDLVWIQRNQPHVSHLFLFDEVFSTDKEWVKALVEARKRHRVNLTFSGYAHPNVVNPDWIQGFREAGGTDFVMGVQSGSDRVNREVFNRNTTQERIWRSAQYMTEAGVPFLIELIGSNPFETEEDFREGVSLLQKMPRPYRLGTVYPLTFWKKFAITDMAFERGIPLRQINSSTWQAEPTPEYAFRNAFFVFIALANIRDFAVEALLDDGMFREKPNVMEELMEALKHSHYHRTRSDSYLPKSDYIASLECELASLRGSRMVQYYFKAKNKLREWLG